MIDKRTKELLSIKDELEKAIGWPVVSIHFEKEAGQEVVKVNLGPMGKLGQNFPTMVGEQLPAKFLLAAGG